MVIVTCRYKKATRHFRLSMVGHAGHAEHGKDIVCSAVSILAYTVAQIVKAMWAGGDLSIPPTVEMTPGKAVIDAVCKSDDSFAEAMHFLFFAQTGYTLLQENNPECIKLIVEEA